MFQKNMSKEYYLSIYEEMGIESLIENIKLNNLFVNRFGSKLKGKEEKLLKQLTQIIDDTGNDGTKKEWKIFLDEIDLINKVYKTFYESKMNKIVKTENPMEAFLLITEQFLEYINNNITGNEVKNIERLNKFQLEGLSEENKKAFYMQLHDLLTREINMVFSSLRFYEYPEHVINLNKVIDEEELKCSYNHFVNVEFNDFLNYAVDAWKYGGRKINGGINRINFDIVNDLDESYFIVLQRNEARQIKEYIVLEQWLDKIGNKFPKGKSIAKFLNLDELRTCCFLQSYLSIEDLNNCKYSVKGIESKKLTIKELVRAYYVLIDISMKRIANRKVEDNSLSNCGILLEKSEIKKLLCSNGILNENTDAIIAQLTYRKGVDIFDAPLIEIEGKYFILPHILKSVDIVKIVFSIIDEIEERGMAFEEEIKRRFTKKGIACTSLFIKDSEQYQCDIAISINDNLYFCECKAWNEVKNINGYYDMLLKMKEAKEQLDRIANKFSKEIEYVNQQFGFEKNHKFRSVNKLVISFNMLGLHRKLEDTYFVDSSCLIKFLDREKPGIRKYQGVEQTDFIPFEGFEEFDGEINNLKFLKMVENPANIELTRRNEIIGINKFELEGFNIIIPMFAQRNSGIRFEKY